MKKKVLSKLDLTLYEETLSNGLTIYMIPKEGNNVYATFTTKYGSKTNTFIPIGEKDMKHVPDGIAHFLEHKVFEQKDIDPFSFFGARGADANAATSNDKTTYMFSGTNAFEENIQYLLDFVQSPYFTDENVEKEKGIITEEILMYEDNPFSKLYEKSLYNTFVEDPIRLPVAGTIESISKITKEMLYTCYHTFYHPSNMFLVITGNIDVDKTIDLIRNNQEKKHFDKGFSIQIKQVDEPSIVAKEMEVISMNVTIPKVSVNVKIPIQEIKGHSLFLIRSALFHFFNSKFGITSKFTEQLKEDSIISEDLAINMVRSDSYFVFMVIGETNHPTVLIQKIKEELKKSSITLEEFERKKKVLMSSYIYMSDNIYSLNRKIVDNLISYGKVIEDVKEMSEFTYHTFEDIIKQADFKNISTVIIDKK